MSRYFATMVRRSVNTWLKNFLPFCGLGTVYHYNPKAASESSTVHNLKKNSLLIVYKCKLVASTAFMLDVLKIFTSECLTLFTLVMV